MRQPQPAIAITPRTVVYAQPNTAPVFIGAHRTFGLFVGSTMIDYRISLVGDDRDGNGFQEVVSLVYQTFGLYADMMSYGSPDAFLEFIKGRIAECGRLLPPPSDDCKKVTCAGLDKRTWPVPLPSCPYPTDELTALDWLPMKLSNMRWTLEHGYLELV